MITANITGSADGLPIAIILARTGSKRLPGKNFEKIITVYGCFSLTALAFIKAYLVGIRRFIISIDSLNLLGEVRKEIDRFTLDECHKGQLTATDFKIRNHSFTVALEEAIPDEAKQWRDITTIFDQRPPKLATDEASSMEVLAYLTEFYNISLDTPLILLQPTSPFVSKRSLLNLMAAQKDSIDSKENWWLTYTGVATGGGYALTPRTTYLKTVNWHPVEIAHPIVETIDIDTKPQLDLTNLLIQQCYKPLSNLDILGFTPSQERTSP